jgi:hypothetical protein
LHTWLFAPKHVLVLAGGGEHHHRDQPAARVGAQALQHVQAAQLGQLQVEQDHGRHAPGVAARELPRAEDELERLAAVARDHHLVGDLAQRAHGQLLVVGVVFHQQDEFVRHGNLLCVGCQHACA